MNAKKILLPLGTLLAAGAIAVGSGATFTSTSANSISAVTSGTLSHANSKADQAVFNLTDIKPGDTVNGGLAITNTGSLPASFSLTELASTNTFADSYLTLAITNTTTGKTVYSGTFGGLADGTKNDLGTIAPAAKSTFTFSVHLAQDAPNTQQGKTAGASYRWDSVQLSGTTSNQ
jgi:spore coat-associated protein N